MFPGFLLEPREILVVRVFSKVPSETTTDHLSVDPSLANVEISHRPTVSIVIRFHDSDLVPAKEMTQFIARLNAVGLGDLWRVDAC